MWKGIKGGKKSDRLPLLRNGRAGRWVAFKLFVFTRNTWRLQPFFFPPFKLPSTLHISKITKPWTQYFKTLNAYLFFFFFFLLFLKPTWTYIFVFFFLYPPFRLPSTLPWTQYLKTLNAFPFFSLFFTFFLPLSFSPCYIFQNPKWNISKPWTQNPECFPSFFSKPAWTFDIFNFFFL